MSSRKQGRNAAGPARGTTGRGPAGANQRPGASAPQSGNEGQQRGGGGQQRGGGGQQRGGGGRQQGGGGRQQGGGDRQRAGADTRPGQSARKMVRAQIARERRRQRTLWTSIIALAVLLIAGLIGWGVWASQRSSDEWTAPAGTNADGSGVVVGSGPVTIDIYEDFICPACGQFEQRIGPTLDQLVTENKVNIVYHPVAYLDRFSTTDYSTRSSAASGCAAENGKFREYAKALFQQQPPEGGAGLSDDQLITIAGKVGLDEGTFGSCLRDNTYRPWTQHVTDAASRAGITGTPTVLVAGKPVESSAEAITAAVTAAGG